MYFIHIYIYIICGLLKSSRPLIARLEQTGGDSSPLVLPPEFSTHTEHSVPRPTDSLQQDHLPPHLRIEERGHWTVSSGSHAIRVTEPVSPSLWDHRGNPWQRGMGFQNLAVFSGSSEEVPEKEGNTFLVRETQSQLLSVGPGGM